MCCDMINDILISASKDKSIKLYIYENNTFNLKCNYLGHQEAVNGIALSPCT
jgi:hypothetical protein